MTDLGDDYCGGVAYEEHWMPRPSDAWEITSNFIVSS